MGVKGLHSFMEHHGSAATVDLRSVGQSHRSCQTIAVDGMGLLRKLHPKTIDWVAGGQYAEHRRSVVSFVSKFRAANFKLVVFMDGAVDDAKQKTWVSRRRSDVKSTNKIAECLSHGNYPPDFLWHPPCGALQCMAQAFKWAGCELVWTVGEADREAHNSEVIANKQWLAALA